MENILIGYIKREFLRDDASADLDAETDLLLSGLLDSLGVMRLVGFIEKQFRISVPPQDVTIDHFMNVLTIATYIADRRDAVTEATS